MERLFKKGPPCDENQGSVQRLEPMVQTSSFPNGLTFGKCLTKLRRWKLMRSHNICSSSVFPGFRPRGCLKAGQTEPEPKHHRLWLGRTANDRIWSNYIVVLLKNNGFGQPYL